MADTLNLQYRDVGDALRDMSFVHRARRVPVDKLKETVASQLERLGVAVSVVEVSQPDPTQGDDFEVEWQAGDDAETHRQQFSLSLAETGWYVERWEASGREALTTWWCGSALEAIELVAEITRRGETARIRPPADATAEQIATILKSGKVERL